MNVVHDDHNGHGVWKSPSQSDVVTDNNSQDCNLCSKDRKVKFKKLKTEKFKRYIHVIFLTEKPRPDGLALAFQECKPGQSCREAVKLARPIWARLGLAHGLRPGLAKH